jgi:hypothetical protein
MGHSLAFPDCLDADLFDVTKPDQLGGRAVIGPANREESLFNISDQAYICRPIVLTVSFQVERLQESSVALENSTHLPRARLRWGSVKGNGDVLFDLQHGLRVSVEASAVAVDLLYESQSTAPTFLPAFPEFVGPEFRVWASLGKGSIAKNPSLTFTERSRSLGVGVITVPNINVPRYARALEIMTDSDPFAAVPPTFTVNYLANAVATSRIISRHTGNDVISIPLGCEAVSITNNGPGTVIHTPIFHLTL